MVKRREVVLTKAERLKIESIRAAAEDGKSGVEIAREMHMRVPAVHRILKEEGIETRTHKQILLDAFREMPGVTNKAVLTERTGLNSEQLDRTAGKLRREYPDEIPDLTSKYEVWNVKTKKKVLLGTSERRVLELIPVFGIGRKGRDVIGRILDVEDSGVKSVIRQLRVKGFDIPYERGARTPSKEKRLMLEYEEAANAIKRHVDNAPGGKKFVPLDSEHAKKLMELEKVPELAEFRAERGRVAKYYYDLGVSYGDAAKLADMSLFTLSKRLRTYGYPKRTEILSSMKGKKKKSKKGGRSGPKSGPSGGEILFQRLLKGDMAMPDSIKESAEKKRVELARKVKKRVGKR